MDRLIDSIFLNYMIIYLVKSGEYNRIIKHYSLKGQLFPFLSFVVLVYLNI